MDVVSLECPNCGGRIERKGSEYFARCPFCDTEVAFDEIREEAQIDELKDRIGTYEQRASEDEAKRARLHKWIMIRNLLLAIIGVLNFCGFTLVGATDGFDNRSESILGIGSLLCFLSWLAAFAVPFFMGSAYPPYNVLTGETEPAGKVRAGLRVALIELAVLIGSSFAAYIVMNIMGVV